MTWWNLSNKKPCSQGGSPTRMIFLVDRGSRKKTQILGHPTIFLMFDLREWESSPKKSFMWRWFIQNIPVPPLLLQCHGCVKILPFYDRFPPLDCPYCPTGKWHGLKFGILIGFLKNLWNDSDWNEVISFSFQRWCQFFSERKGSDCCCCFFCRPRVQSSLSTRIVGHGKPLFFIALIDPENWEKWIHWSLFHVEMRWTVRMFRIECAEIISDLVFQNCQG